MKILVTGAEGLLGTTVVADAGKRGHDVSSRGRTSLDVTDSDAVRRAIEAAIPEVVIHCAAYTAVDRAESEPELADAVNRGGTENVARACAEARAALVYVSTDYVFDGRKRAPYLPQDDPHPLSVYGRTKLEGERAALAAGEALIIRTSWLYSASSGFVPAILRKARSREPLRVVDDQRGRPTWAPHAAAAILDLTEAAARGIWHVAGAGECSWLELARAALRPVSTEEYSAPAPRPAYSSLDLTATEARLGRTMPHWREGLRQFVARSGAHSPERYG
jgi:dTDP-4-dehydrorhamnose reductase